MNIVILMNPGRYSRLKLADFQAAFRALGHAAGPLELSAIQQADAQGTTVELMRSLAQSVRNGELQAVLSYSTNALQALPPVELENGKKAGFWESMNLPVVNYWPDPMLETADHGAYLIWKYDRYRMCGARQIHLVKDAAAAQELREVFGISGVVPLPLSVNTSQFAPRARCEDADIVFVGGCDPAPGAAQAVQELPLYDETIRRQIAAARPRLGEIVRLMPWPHEWRSAVIALLESAFDRKAAGGERSFWEELRVVAVSQEQRTALEMLRGAPEVYWQVRQVVLDAHTVPRGQVVKNVSGCYPMVVLGTENWRAWGVNYQGWADYAQQADWYSRARIGLNYTMAWDEVGANYKVFEITACRTLCLTNYRRQLEELFDLDREIVVYRSAEELMDKLDFYLRNEAERKRIALAGYRRTCAHHTFVHRAKNIVDYLQREHGVAGTPAAEPAGV